MTGQAKKKREKKRIQGSLISKIPYPHCPGTTAAAATLSTLIYLLTNILFGIHILLCCYLTESRGDASSSSEAAWEKKNILHVQSNGVQKSPSDMIIFAWEKIQFLQSYRNPIIEKLTWGWTGLRTYIRMNSHICIWLPSSRVAIGWRRKGTYWQTTRDIKQWTRTPWAPPIFARIVGTCGFGEMWSMSVVRLKKWYDEWCCFSPANVLESNSLIELAICWDQSPLNWDRRPNDFFTNAPWLGWSKRWCHGDVSVSILCDVPLWKRITLWTLA